MTMKKTSKKKVAHKKRRPSSIKKYDILSVKDERVFKVAVVSTMSSGKSTIINALAGQELLPSINQACTARTLSLLDNDHRKKPRGHILYNDHTYERVDDCTIDTIRTFNSNAGKPISDIIVECDITGIHNAKTALLIVDTPGVNNHFDDAHRKETLRFLDSMKSGLILYVINATQLSTFDDASFLCVVRELIESNPDLKLLFIINKMDEVDPAKEHLPSLIRATARYLKEHGIDNPNIIPVSAYSALLFKKALAHMPLTENERDSFHRLYKKYSKRIENGSDCRDLIWFEDIQSAPSINIDGDVYLPSELTGALEQTGLPILEHEIESAMLQAAHASAPTVKKV